VTSSVASGAVAPVERSQATAGTQTSGAGDGEEALHHLGLVVGMQRHPVEDRPEQLRAPEQEHEHGVQEDEELQQEEPGEPRRHGDTVDQGAAGRAHGLAQAPVKREPEPGRQRCHRQRDQEVADHPQEEQRDGRRACDQEATLERDVAGGRLLGHGAILASCRDAGFYKREQDQAVRRASNRKTSTGSAACFLLPPALRRTDGRNAVRNENQPIRARWPVTVIAAAALLGASCGGPAENPRAMPDESWISLGGTVEAVSADSFVLDYGTARITVEMDDGDRDADAYKLLVGDQVTVNGRIDDDFFEATTIEASSVHVKKLDTYFYASSLDEESDGPFIAPTPLPPYETIVQGTVTAVADDELTLDTGLRMVTVEVDRLGYDPLDDDGYQRIDVGDRVNVAGAIDDDFFAGREIVARSVVKVQS